MLCQIRIHQSPILAGDFFNANAFYGIVWYSTVTEKVWYCTEANYSTQVENSNVNRRESARPTSTVSAWSKIDQSCTDTASTRSCYPHFFRLCQISHVPEVASSIFFCRQIWVDEVHPKKDSVSLYHVSLKHAPSTRLEIASWTMNESIATEFIENRYDQ